MDLGDSLTLLPVQGRALAGQCVSCGAARHEASRPTGRVTECDDDVVVSRAPGRAGFVVVPRLHVRVLEELSLSCRAGVLAAVQRAANAVRVENPWSGVRVVIVADPPTSEGHMAIHVQPGGPGGSRGLSPGSA